MLPDRKGSIHLFRLWGISVFMHWSWFVVAYFQISRNASSTEGYGSKLWFVYEYLALFLIVLLHEFGHALACRQVGGRADQIVLWPFGGVAFVSPPPRPGATLWSIAAGPLVNVILAPILFGALMAARALHVAELHSDLYELLRAVLFIDVGLFCFNMLPIFPLDGGQILQSILWFWLGRARSLMVASSIGMILGVAGLIWLLIKANNETWLILISVFILMNCWRGMKQARILTRQEAAPRRESLACPKCQAHPMQGDFWMCARCRTTFDMFGTRGVCPKCGTIYNVVRCEACGESSPLYSFGEPPV